MYTYREATEKDFEGISQLVKTKEELFLVYPNGNVPFTVEQVRELSQIRDDLSVVTEGNKIVGFANLYNLKPRESAFIGNVVIDQNYRSQGLGKKMVMRMQSIAFEKHQLPEVRISVFSDNTPALLLYSKMGFTPFAIEERIDYCGERVALIHMNKKLDKLM